jgi:hypothetical protein
MHSPQLSNIAGAPPSTALDFGGFASSDARKLQHPANHQTRHLLMSEEFERLKALLRPFESSDHAALVDRGEAAKLAARWGRFIHQSSRAARRVSSDGVAQPGCFWGQCLAKDD